MLAGDPLLLDRRQLTAELGADGNGVEPVALNRKTRNGFICDDQKGPGGVGGAHRASVPRPSPPFLPRPGWSSESAGGRTRHSLPVRLCAPLPIHSRRPTHGKNRRKNFSSHVKPLEVHSNVNNILQTCPHFSKHQFHTQPGKAHPIRERNVPRPLLCYVESKRLDQHHAYVKYFLSRFQLHWEIKGEKELSNISIIGNRGEQTNLST